MHMMGFAELVVRWTKSFLSDRSAACSIGNYVGPMLPINIGVLQGSPCSPILSVIYSAPILKFLAEDPFFTNKQLPIIPRSYIDDFSFLAISHSPTHNLIALGNTLIRLTDLLLDVGMKIDPEISDLIHFSRARSIPPAPINVSVYGRNLSIIPKPVVRWLGIFFDQKLTFNEHVRILANRATSVANGIRILANTIWGLAQRHIRILFKTCVLPILTYASSIWYQTDCPQKHLIERLERVQNISLRQICGAFKTTPIPAIQVLSHQPPLELTLKKLSELAAIRLLKLPFRSLVSQRLPDVWRKGRKGDAPFWTLTHLPHNTSTARYLSPIESLSSLLDPRGERVFPFAKLCSPEIPPLSDNLWFHTDITADKGDEKDALIDQINDITKAFSPGRHLFFCDGSHNEEDGAGAGVVHYNRGDIAYKKDFDGFISIGAGPKATAYDAEMLALTIAATHAFNLAYEAATNPDFELTSIWIYSDSTSALQKIIDYGPHPGQIFSLCFIEHIDLALQAHPDLQIYLCWSPGHSHVVGNEVADREAKAATRCRGFHNSTIAYLKRRSKEAVKTRRQLLLQPQCTWQGWKIAFGKWFFLEILDEWVYVFIWLHFCYDFECRPPVVIIVLTTKYPLQCIFSLGKCHTRRWVSKCLDDIPSLLGQGLWNTKDYGITSNICMRPAVLDHFRSNVVPSINSHM